MSASATPTHPREGISEATTLGHIVTADPRAARLLEAFGLDYCCGGARSLVDACTDDGITVEVDDVLAALARLDPAPAEAWTAMAPAELVDHLEATHHAYLKAEFARLDALATKVAGVHGANHPELADVARLYAELRADLEPHLMKEERVLFPMIRELAASAEAPAFHCGTLANPIGMMRLEHDRAGELLAELRRVTSGYEVPGDGCASYRALYDGLAELEADTHLHVHKENNVLFPAVQAMEADRS